MSRRPVGLLTCVGALSALAGILWLRGARPETRAPESLGVECAPLDSRTASPQPSPAERDERVLEGWVRLADGQPAPSARVCCEDFETLADEAGAFRLPLTGALAPGAILAAAWPGAGTVFSSMDEVLATRAAVPLVLVLNPEPLAIAGRLVDAQGRPLAGWQVSFLEGTPLTSRRMPPVLAEDLAGARPRIQTDAEGRFLLPGLLARDYVVQACEKRTLVLVRSAPVPAGTEGLVLELSPEPLYPRVAGRVLTRWGLPVAKARVRVELAVFQTARGTQSISGAGTETDTQGRFELRDVPRHHVHLTVSGEAVFPARYEFGAEPVEDLQLSVAARCTLQVALAKTAPDDVWVEVRDERGLSLPISELGSTNTVGRMPLAPGASLVLQTSEDARTVRALSRKGAAVGEVASIPVLLGSDQLTEVRLEGF